MWVSKCGCVGCVIRETHTHTHTHAETACTHSQRYQLRTHVVVRVISLMAPESVVFANETLPAMSKLISSSMAGMA